MGMLLKSCKPFYGHYFTILKYASLVIALLILFLPFYFNLGLGLDVILMLAGGYLLLALAFALYIKIVNDAIIYGATDGELTKDEGVLQKKHTVIPYSKISNLILKRGLFDRFFNLASLQIDATGGGSDYEIMMPRLTLKDANAMTTIINDLIARQQGGQGEQAAGGLESDKEEAKEEKKEEKPKPEPLPRLYALGDMGKERIDELEHMAYSRQMEDADAVPEGEPDAGAKRRKQTKGKRK
jgi:uncharacterized membrane protein YdbT with pleckstrin-like domain